ncbi:MAG: hypothetical protein KDA24_26365 [Deltaproteobacteria bacterium]|nr:hypothetical protein [Deltaproteobacteria bacterium]
MNVDRGELRPILHALVALCIASVATSSLVGCPRDKGELGSLIEDADARAVVGPGSRDLAAPVAGKANRYVKREGLHIDMVYLAGRALDEVEPEDVADQLGVEISREELRDTEVHIVFDKAEIWVQDGTIYRVRSQLAHLMDIPTALGVSGFPLSLGTPIDGARVLRWNRAWGTRRIELTRSEEDRRLYSHIDVWDFLPRERR